MEQPTPNSIPLRAGTVPHAGEGGVCVPWLEPLVQKTPAPRGAVIVCPGGGYCNRAEHEGTPIAQEFVKAGMQAFVLQYRVSPSRHPEPIRDAARAIRMVRARAQEWNILPDHIAILGFSAGGHLCASAGILADHACTREGDALDSISSRPDAMIPCYPVLSNDPAVAHMGSFQNLLGDKPAPELLRLLCLEEQVNSRTPPTFLWHTADDGAVPVENSLRLATALRKNKIPFELHVYPKGAHGLGLATGDKHIATWMPLCIEWLRGMGW